MIADLSSYQITDFIMYSRTIYRGLAAVAAKSIHLPAKRRKAPGFIHGDISRQNECHRNR
jgi:hypothetical protein